MAKKRAKTGVRFGFLDGHGNEVVEPRFEQYKPFSDGGAWVLEGKRWGRIDPAGAWIIEPTYDEVRDGSHGLRLVIAGNRALWVDERDEQPPFDGFRAAMPNQTELDPRGRYWGNRGGTSAAHSLACKGGRWELYTGEGEPAGVSLAEGWQPWLSGPECFVASSTTTGAWRVFAADGSPRSGELSGSNWGISAERMVFSTGDGYGAYDLDGQVAIKPGQFRFISMFDDEGHAVAWKGDDRVAIIDSDGATIAECVTEPIGDRQVSCPRGFRGNHAVVELTGGANYHGRRANLLCRDGSWQFETWPYSVDLPSEHGFCEVTPVQHQRDIWRLDGSGLVPTPQSWVRRIAGWGWSVCDRETKHVGLLDEDGAWILEPAEQSIAPFDDNHVIRRHDSMDGLWARHGDWAIAPEWTQLERCGELALAASGGELKSMWRGGPTGRRKATWKLLERDGSVAADLGKLAWGPGKLCEDRMSFAKRVSLT